jgi:arylsulfatase A-like enzyme
VAQIDEEIGKILRVVHEKMGDNVLLIFTCDHGEMLGNHRLWGKGRCGYEDVLNVPLFVRMPGQSEGHRSDALVSLIDIMPTCFAAVGAESPKTDGRNLELSLKDGGYEYVFSESENFIVVTDGRYKYIHLRRNNSTQAELYDLESDPHEYQNQVHNPAYSDTLAMLRGAMVNQFLGDLLP